MVQLTRPDQGGDPVTVAALRRQATEWNKIIGTREKAVKLRSSSARKKGRLTTEVKKCLDWGGRMDRQYKVLVTKENGRDNSKLPLKTWQLRVLDDAKYPLPQLTLPGGGVNDPTEGGHDLETLEKPLPSLGDPKRKLDGEDAHGDSGGSGSEKKTRR